MSFIGKTRKTLVHEDLLTGKPNEGKVEEAQESSGRIDEIFGFGLRDSSKIINLGDSFEDNELSDGLHLRCAACEPPECNQPSVCENAVQVR